MHKGRYISTTSINNIIITTIHSHWLLGAYHGLGTMLITLHTLFTWLTIPFLLKHSTWLLKHPSASISPP